MNLFDRSACDIAGFHRQRGATLIESLLYSTVALAFITGGLVFWQQTDDRQKVAQLSQQVIASHAKIRRELAAPGSFHEGDVTDYFIQASLVSFPEQGGPAAADTTLFHPWGGEVWIDNVDEASFAIHLEGIPDRICRRLAIEASTGNTFDVFPMNALFLVDQEAFPLNNQISVDEAVAACDSDDMTEAPPTTTVRATPGMRVVPETASAPEIRAMHLGRVVTARQVRVVTARPVRVETDLGALSGGS